MTTTRINAIWTRAKGNCGMNVKKGKPVFGTYVNGIPLFAFESRACPFGHVQYTCIPVGLNAIHGASLEEVQSEGVKRAAGAFCVSHPERKMSLAEFKQLLGHHDARPEPKARRRTRTEASAGTQKAA